MSIPHGSATVGVPPGAPGHGAGQAGLPEGACALVGGPEPTARVRYRQIVRRRRQCWMVDMKKLLLLLAAVGAIAAVVMKRRQAAAAEAALWAEATGTPAPGVKPAT